MNVPETFFSVSEELRLFGLSCVMGAALGVVYDLFRTIRLLLPHNGFLVAFEDVLFMGIYGTALLTFASAAARGELRAYYVIGNFAGFLLYLLTLGNVVSAVMKKLFLLVKKTIFLIFSPIKRFIAFLCKKMMPKFVGSTEFIVNKIKKITMLLLKPLFLLYNRKEIKKKERGNGGKKVKEKNIGTFQ